mmetsp:Transcript_28952/g.27886  ORF Transcript_28952/g.27886 Transcript_28952/m.27886 type:complete len:132 (-) Transcript_28952:112-507(-)
MLGDGALAPHIELFILSFLHDFGLDDEIFIDLWVPSYVVEASLADLRLGLGSEATRVLQVCVVFVLLVPLLGLLLLLADISTESHHEGASASHIPDLLLPELVHLAGHVPSSEVSLPQLPELVGAPGVEGA